MKFRYALLLLVLALAASSAAALRCYVNTRGGNKTEEACDPGMRYCVKHTENLAGDNPSYFCSGYCPTGNGVYVCCTQDLCNAASYAVLAVSAVVVAVASFLV